MKWTRHVDDADHMHALLCAEMILLCFHVTKERRCWHAYMATAGRSYIVGDYRTERLAKAACRRKAGRIVDSLKRGIRA
jgi:hypothetical protein